MAPVEAEELKALLILVAMLIAVGIFLLVVWRAWRQRQVLKDLQLPSDSKNPMAPQKISTTSPSEDGSGPIITVSSIQPKPFFRSQQLSYEDDEGIEEGDEGERERDLGRLYFALKYETLTSTLIIKLLRGEDIPANGKTRATYVDVSLIPLNSETLQFTPYQTTLNITFKETYQFPLSLQDLSYQTIHFHICRYDMHSRREDIGEVFLALAELVAQGIDITREVYLCRNLITSQRIQSQKRCLTDSDRSGSDVDNEEPRKPARKRKPGELWDRLRSAVLEREFIVPTPLMWEPLFYQGGSEGVSPTGLRYASPAHEADRTEYFSLTEAGDCAEAGMENVGSGEFSISDSDFEIVWDTPTQGPRTPHFSFSSDYGESTPLDINPAPEDYYKITPQLTPLSKEPLISWPVPQTFTPGRSRTESTSTEMTEQENEDRAILPRNYSTDFSPARSKIRRVGSFTRTGAMTSMLSEQTKTNATFTKSRHKLPGKAKNKETPFMSRLKFSFQKFKKEKSESDDSKNRSKRKSDEEQSTKKSETDTDSDQGSYISVKFTLQTDRENSQQPSPEQAQAASDISKVASEIEQFTGTRDWDMLVLPPREEGDGGASDPVPKQDESQSDVYVPTSEDEVARESSGSPWKLRTEHAPKPRRKKSKSSREPAKKQSQGSLFSRRTRKSPGMRKKKASSSAQASSSDDSQ